MGSRSLRSGASGVVSLSESEVGDGGEDEVAVASLGGRVARRERMLLIWRAMNSAVVGSEWRGVGVEVVRKAREVVAVVIAGVSPEAGLMVERAALSFEIRAALEEAFVLRV